MNIEMKRIKYKDKWPSAGDAMRTESVIVLFK